MPITSVVYDQRQNHARKPHGVFQLKRYEGNIIHDDNNRPRKPCNIRSCLETGNAFETVTRQCEGIRSNFQLVRVPPHLSLYGMIDTHRRSKTIRSVTWEQKFASLTNIAHISRGINCFGLETFSRLEKMSRAQRTTVTQHYLKRQ